VVFDAFEAQRRVPPTFRCSGRGLDSAVADSWPKPASGSTSRVALGGPRNSGGPVAAHKCLDQTHLNQQPNVDATVDRVRIGPPSVSGLVRFWSCRRRCREIMVVMTAKKRAKLPTGEVAEADREWITPEVAALVLQRASDGSEPLSWSQVDAELEGWIAGGSSPDRVHHGHDEPHHGDKSVQP
jgi:hypothetical protein